MKTLGFKIRFLAVFCLSVLIILAVVGSAVAADTWVKWYQFSKPVLGRKMTLTSDGGYVLVGDYQTQYSSNYDTVILKLDSRGSVGWKKVFGGPNIEFIHGIIQTKDGGFVAAGLWDYYSANRSAWVFKLDSQGALLWQKTVGINGKMVEARFINQTDDGGFVVLAEVFNSSSFDLLLLKFRPNGDIEWNKLLKFSQYAPYTTLMSSLNVIQTSDGGYAVTGVIREFANFYDTTMLIKLDNQGNIEWQKVYDHTLAKYGLMRLTGLKQTSDGGYILAGPARESGSPGWQDYSVVLKLDNNGSISWQKRLNGLEFALSGPFFVMQTIDGEYLLAGGTVHSNIAKLNADGDIVWARRISGGGSPSGVYQMPDGGYIFSDISSNGIDLYKFDEQGSVSGSYYCQNLSRSFSPSATEITSDVTESSVPDTAAEIVLSNSNATFLDTSVMVSDICTSETPIIAVTPPSLSYGSVELGSNALLTLTVSNTGNANLILQPLSIAGSGSAAYGFSGGCSSIAPNTSCAFNTTFTPTTLGAKIATLSIPSNDPNTSMVTVPLSGTGTDTVSPTTVRSVSGIAGNNGWYTSDVTVALSAADAGSGVKEIHYTINGAGTVITGNTASFTINAEGSHSVTYYAKDNANNTETVHPLTIRIDKTAPTITAMVSPAANANGWYNSDVMVTFTCNDAVSGIASCSGPVTVTAEGANQVITGTAVDNAGNTATTSVTLNIDKTAPSLSVAASHAMLWPPNHKMVTVTPSVSVTDANPGTTVKLVSVTSSEPDNELGDGDTANDIVVNSDGTISLRAERSGTGSGRVYTITYQATDIAGNISTATAAVIVPHDMR